MLNANRLILESRGAGDPFSWGVSPYGAGQPHRPEPAS